MKQCRICIIGPSSSGKSTLAVVLGDKLHLPVFHLDQYAHHLDTNWVRRPIVDFQQDHTDIIKKEKWIIEGNYNFLMPDRLARADTVIFHHFNRFGCLWRFIKRAYKNKNRSGMLQGAAEQIKWGMIQHILFKSPRNQKKYLKILKQYPHLNVIHISSFKEINDFVNSL